MWQIKQYPNGIAEQQVTFAGGPEDGKGEAKIWERGASESKAQACVAFTSSLQPSNPRHRLSGLFIVDTGARATAATLPGSVST